MRPDVLRSPTAGGAWLVMRAAALIDMGRHPQAEALLRQALAHDPSSPLALGLLAHCLRHQGRVDEAVSAARSAVAVAPDRPAAHVALAYGLQAAGRDEAATAAAREAVHLDPTDATALAALAQCAMSVSLPEAEEAARSLRSIAPDHFIGHHLMARINMRRAQWEAAERASRASLRCQPISAAEHANLALILEHLGRLDEAQVHHREALRLDPRADVARGNLHISLRVAEERGQNGEAALTSAVVASTLAPEQRARGLTQVIHRALQDGRFAQAAAAAEEARSILDRLPLDTPEERRAALLVADVVARVDARTGRLERAASDLVGLLDEAREILPAAELCVFLNNVGTTLQRAGDPRGIAVLTELLDMERRTGNPDGVGRALLNLGAASAAAGDDARAAACYRECADIAARSGHAARHAVASINLARVCLRGGRLDEAERHLVEAGPGLDALPAMTRVVVGNVEGALELRRGRVEQARRILLLTARALHRGGDRRNVDAPALLAEIAARQGRLRIATVHLDAAAARATGVDTRATVAAARAVLEEARAARR